MAQWVKLYHIELVPELPRGFVNDYGPVIPNNGVILKAISAVIERAEGK